MSKVQNARLQQVIPRDYFCQKPIGCSSFEQVLKIVPQVGTFTCGNTITKQIIELPNVNIKLSEVFIEANISVGFTSNSGSDTFSSLGLSLVRYASSIIQQCRLLIGSTEASNIRSCGTAFNWQENMSSNSITRNAEQLNNVTPFVYASSTGQTYRFPITHMPNDLWSLQNGILPLQHMLKANLELYFDSAANVIYSTTGTIVGTSFSTSYTINSWQLSVVQIMDPALDMQISTNGFCISYVEWYSYQQAITTAAQQVIQVPVSFSSLIGIVFGIRRVADLTSPTLGTKMYLMSSELTDLKALDLRINSQKRQQDVFVGVNAEAIPETRRVFPVANYADYWSNLTNNLSTNQMLALLAGQSYCTSVCSGLDTQRVNSQCYLEFTLTANLSTASVIDIFLIHHRMLTVSQRSLSIDE